MAQSYQKSQYLLNPNTSVGNVANYNPRSSIADAAQGLDAIFKGVVNVKQTQIQAEMQELSMQTRLLAAEGAKLEKVIAAAETSQLNNFAEVSAAAGIQYENDLRAAGNDPDKQLLARDNYITSITTARDGLSPEVQKRVHGTVLKATTQATSTYNANMHSIAVEDWKSKAPIVEAYGQWADPIEAKDFRDRYIADGVELGLTKGVAIDTLYNAENNLFFTQNNPVDVINSGDFSIVDDRLAKLNADLANDPMLANKANFTAYRDNLLSLKGKMTSGLHSVLSNSVQTLDRNTFEDALQRGVNAGVITEDEHKAYILNFDTNLNKTINSPEALAARGFSNTGGMAKSIELFPYNPAAQTKFDNQVENELAVQLGKPEDANVDFIKYQRDNNPEIARKVVNSLISQRIGALMGLIESKPNDPTSEEYAKWSQLVGQQSANLDFLRDQGGTLVPTDQLEKIVVIDTLLDTGSVDRVKDALSVLANKGGDIPNISAESTLGRSIITDIPVDSYDDALRMYSTLTSLAGMSGEDAMDKVNGVYGLQSLEWFGLKASGKAVDLMSSWGLSEDNLKYVGKTLSDTRSNLFDKATADRLAYISEGKDPYLAVRNGELRFTSENGGFTFKFTPAQRDAFITEIQRNYDAAQRPMGDLTKDSTSTHNPTAIDAEVEAATKRIEQTASSMTVEQVQEVSGLVRDANIGQAAAEDNLRRSYESGASEAQVAQTYLAESLPNVMGLLQAKFADRYTAAQYKELSAYLGAEGKAYLEHNQGILGRSTDGLFEYLMTLSEKKTGGPLEDARIKVESALADAYQRLDKAQETFDNLPEDTSRTDRARALRDLQYAQKVAESAEIRAKEEPTVFPYRTILGEPVEPMLPKAPTPLVTIRSQN